MELHMNLKTVNADVIHYPNRKMKQCTCVSSDNSTYEADICPEEVDLILHLKSIKHKLNSQEYKKLIKLIDALSDAAYEQGSSDEIMNNCEDL